MNDEVNYCSQCGVKITQEAKFCSNCGNSLTNSSTQIPLDKAIKIEVTNTNATVEKGFKTVGKGFGAIGGVFKRNKEKRDENKRQREENKRQKRKDESERKIREENIRKKAEQSRWCVQGVEREVDIIKGEKLKQYSVADELMKWAKLKEEGHISEDEFNEARAKLLKRK